MRDWRDDRRTFCIPSTVTVAKLLLVACPGKPCFNVCLGSSFERAAPEGSRALKFRNILKTEYMPSSIDDAVGVGCRFDA